MSIRVLHIIGDILKGGTESVAFNYYRYIDRDKIQFDFVAHEDSPFEIPDEIKALGCRVYKIPSYKHLSAYVKAIRKICLEGNYLIVHSHMNALSVFPLFAALQAAVPVRIAHSHSTAVWGVKTEFKRTLMKEVLRPFGKLFPTHLLACSEHAGKWLFGEGSMKAGKVTILKNAIDTSRFRYNSEAGKQNCKELGLENSFVIGHVGRYVPPKNHEYILNIFIQAYTQNNHLRLLLIGDGPLKENIEKRADEFNRLQKTKVIVFVPSCDNVEEYYAAMDTFVFPSLYEGFGIVAIEAQCAGLPCICSKNVPEEVNAGNASFLPLSDTGIWANEILRLSHTPKDREKASQEFSKEWDIADKAKILESFYQEVLRGKGLG